MNFENVSPLVNTPEESSAPAYYFQVDGSFGSGIHGRKAHIRSKSSMNWFDNRTSAATKKAGNRQLFSCNGRESRPCISS